MKTVSMSGSRRENVGKKDAKALRNQGKVPCVIYGGEEQIHFAIAEADFRHLVYSPDIAFVELKIDDKVYKAILQDMQFHPVTDSIYHADFVELVDGKKVVMGVPVRHTGIAIGVKAGGKLITKLRNIKVKALPEFIPESITVDVTELQIGNSIQVKEIEIENAELLDPPNRVIIGVRTARVLVELDEEEEGEEGEEGSVEGSTEGKEEGKESTEG